MKIDKQLIRYIDQLVGARELEMTLFPEKFEDTGIDLNTFREFYGQTVTSFDSKELTAYHNLFVNYCAKIMDYRLFNGQSSAHNCHESCETIMRAIHQEDSLKLREALFDLKPQVTIGDVLVKGQPQYKVTKKSIKDIIAEGFNPNKTLNVHVWITLFDGTVFDPTIAATLVAKKMLPPQEMSSMHIQPFGMTNDINITYKPLLIDNEFYSRVDRDRSI
ncbi:DUF2612 domain-containing protein [Vibrio crassostreae]|nr:DUF2612 domain-containing protein [Vibrio crassostreae]CAK2062778.1 DUF2612 domain-containing protein [Vibrio crassostreae]CAK2349110.1 DUF2612 domain-containing protein [Vibrio crassostreae]CAK2750780.1 DUF2612 domain-containing protein [Vibrio crassostreae]CAK2867001.1 DUF2612 domain-containing protein [Vibrio crassostreae]